MNILDMQSELMRMGFDPGGIDGAWGPKTYAACRAALEASWVDAKSWSEGRVKIATQQLICSWNGIDPGAIDGLMGPNTKYALSVYDKKVEPRPEGKPSKLASPTDVWPSEKNVPHFFGPVGQNQMRIELPYPMRLAWDLGTTVTRMSLHEKVGMSAARVFDRVLDHYGLEEIERLRLNLFGGSLNVRKKRGGASWSMHAWGIAIDIDPERNQLSWGRDRAELAKPAYDVWWKLWEEEGWFSLGREKNFDWMHVQAARP